MILDRLIEYDTQLFLYLNGLGTETWDSFWMKLTDIKSSFPLFLLLFYLMYRQLGLRGMLLTFLAIALMITFTDQLTNLFKYQVGRLRPCHNVELEGIMRAVKSPCGGLYSYFSGHASNSFAAATFLSLLLGSKYRWVPYPLLVWALGVAYSRIYIGVHYPLDTISGTAAGLLIGWGSYALYNRTLTRIKWVKS